MKPFISAIFFLSSGAAIAQTVPGLKAGLWEVRPITRIEDGRDVGATMAATRARMEKSLENLPAEQKKQMQAAIAGTTKICITPAQLAQSLPMVDPQGNCQTDNLVHAGNKTSFEFHCNRAGRTSAGKGSSTASGEMIHTRLDMTSTDAQGVQHNMQTESEMTYLGVDCQG